MTSFTLTGTGVGRQAVIGPIATVHTSVDVDPDTVVTRNGIPVPADKLPELIVGAFNQVEQDLKDQAAGASGSVAAVLAAAAQIAADLRCALNRLRTSLQGNHLLPQWIMLSTSSWHCLNSLVG